jgi:hypothetical protein
MARRLTPSSAPLVKRPVGRPRKGGLPAGARAAAAADHRAGNASDAARLAYLERGKSAFRAVEAKRAALQSARGVFNAIIKEARKAGAGQVAWVIGQMRRDPMAVAEEIRERNAMLKVAKIPVGVQLELEITGAWMAPLRAR